MEQNGDGKKVDTKVITAPNAYELTRLMTQANGDGVFASQPVFADGVWYCFLYSKE